MIIIDARAYSDIVDEEVTWLVQSENIDKALVILDKEEIYAGNKATPYRALQPYSDIVMDEESALSEASLRLRGKPHESQSSTSLGTHLSEEAPLSEASLAIQAKSSANQNKKGLSTKGFAILVAALGILTASSSLLSMIDDTGGWLGVFRHAISVYVNNVRWFFQHAFSFVGISLPSWIADYLAIGISNFGFTNSQSYWHNGRSHAAQIIDGILDNPDERQALLERYRRLGLVFRDKAHFDKLVRRQRPSMIFSSSLALIWREVLIWPKDVYTALLTLRFSWKQVELISDPAVKREASAFKRKMPLIYATGTLVFIALLVNWLLTQHVADGV